MSRVVINRGPTKKELAERKKIAKEAIRDLPVMKMPKPSKRKMKEDAALPTTSMSKEERFAQMLRDNGTLPKSTGGGHAESSESGTGLISASDVNIISTQAKNFAYGLMASPHPRPVRMRQELEANPCIRRAVDTSVENTIEAIIGANVLINATISYGICYANAMYDAVQPPPAQVIQPTVHESQPQNGTGASHHASGPRAQEVPSTNPTPGSVMDNVSSVHRVPDGTVVRRNESEAVGAGPAQSVDSQPNFHSIVGNSSEAGSNVRVGPQGSA